MGIFNFFRKKEKGDEVKDDGIVNEIMTEVKKEIEEKNSISVEQIESIVKKTIEKYEKDLERAIYEKELVEEGEFSVGIYHESQTLRRPINRIEICEEIDSFIEENPEVYNAVKLYASYMLYGSGELKLETYKVKVITKDSELEKKALDVIQEFENKSKIKRKLYTICQELFKFGDAFLELLYDNEGKLVNVVRIPSRDVIPVLDHKTEEVIKLYQIIDKNINISELLTDSTYRNKVINEKKVVEFSNEDEQGKQQFIHISDGTPVGASDSPLKNLAITWKILKLLEESLVIHRITRAKRLLVFLLDVTGKTPIKIRKYITKFKHALQSIFTINLEGGTIYKNKSTFHYGTDIIIPVKKDSATKVQTIPADTSVSRIEDLQYYYNRILDSLLISHIFGSKKTGKEEQIENAFYRFIRTYQAQLSFALKDLYMILLKTHGIKTDNLDIAIIFPSPDVKEELKLIDTILRRVMVINQLIAVIGVIPPKEWIIQYVFKDLTQQEIKEFINKLQQEEEKYSETSPTEPLFGEEAGETEKEDTDLSIFTRFLRDTENLNLKEFSSEKNPIDDFLRTYIQYLKLHGKTMS